jgi:two-component system alkaline phosphatase synthesis response regulator PhoP
MTQPPPSNSKILIVEDDACAALLFKSVLQREGYAIQHCADGEAALQLLGQEKFDAVVLDLMMPRVDGMQVLKQMRSSVEHALTPVIVITAARLKVLEEAATRYNARFFLDKTQTDKLASCLKEIMAERGANSTGPRLRMASPAPLGDGATKAPAPAKRS